MTTLNMWITFTIRYIKIKNINPFTWQYSLIHSIHTPDFNLFNPPTNWNVYSISLFLSPPTAIHQSHYKIRKTRDFCFMHRRWKIAFHLIWLRNATHCGWWLERVMVGNNCYETIFNEIMNCLILRYIWFPPSAVNVMYITFTCKYYCLNFC